MSPTDQPRDEHLTRRRIRSVDSSSTSSSEHTDVPLSRRARRELELREAQEQVLRRDSAAQVGRVGSRRALRDQGRVDGEAGRRDQGRVDGDAGRAGSDAGRPVTGRRTLRNGLIPADYDTPSVDLAALGFDVVSSKTAPIPVDEILAEIAAPSEPRKRGRRAKPLDETAERVDAEPVAATTAPAAAAPAAAAPAAADPEPLVASPLPADVPADAAETPLDEADPVADAPTVSLLREIELDSLTIEPMSNDLDPLQLEVEPDPLASPVTGAAEAIHIPAPAKPRRSERRVRRVRTAWRPAAAARRPRRETSTGSRPSASAVRRPAWFKAAFSGVAMLFVLGMTAVMALPTTVSASPIDAGIVQSALTQNTPGQELVTANTAATGAVDRDGYAVTDAGELQAAGYSSAQMLVGRQLAQEIMAAYASGKLVGSVPDHIKEIQYIADGVTVPDCGVDYRILEIIVIALHNFDQVGVSDINRKCTGQIEGAGTSSSHYIDGGGHAVDFYLLNNASLNGRDANTLKMISILDPIMPKGARVGQASCRTSAGIQVQLTNWTEFDDSCTHMHIDVPVSDAPLLLSDSSILGQ